MSCTRKVLIGECGICDKQVEENSDWVRITKDTVIPDGDMWITEKVPSGKLLVDIYKIRNNRWVCEQDTGITYDIPESFLAYMPVIVPEPFE